jgi:hypothetical protein
VLLVKRMEIIFFIAFSSETQSLVGKACQGFRQRTKRYLVVRFIKRNWRTWLVPFLERRLGCPVEVLILRWHQFWDVVLNIFIKDLSSSVHSNLMWLLWTHLVGFLWLKETTSD